jgi:prepilin signal peptidase PulO-like enzyme (type II secretory pathway)
LFFFFISKFTKEAIGYGDSWLILILGIYLGSFEVLQVLFWATILAAIVALFLLCKKRCKRNITIPFVPYLAVAFLGVVCI